MSEIGNTLITRDEGQILREDIMKTLTTTDDIIELDFSEVTRITPSFGDELFGKIIYDIPMNEFKHRIRITNAKEDIKRVIKLSIHSGLELKDMRIR